ncbi:hypothetical protein [Cryptosporangium sp. NPDC048952]|uniref:hypothetical protein n=1 Tax=Cryptosporangium sp. NPDC048952 TaxID=3363961 RepID=UPI0037153C58
MDKKLAEHFRDVHDHVLRTIDAVEAHDRQNEDMRKISAWAAIGLALFRRNGWL